ncbi:MAG: carbohydrate kinase family protein [Terriglobales bacterium]
MEVLGLGNSCVDHLLTVARFPGRGGKLPVRRSALRPGGQVATAMVACARLGLRTGMCLRTGADAYGEIQRQALAAAGVVLDYSRIVPDAPSAVAYILVEEASGDRSVIWSTDPRLAVRPDELPAVGQGALRDLRAVYVDGKDPAAARALAADARAHRLPVISDIDAAEPGCGDIIAEVTDFIGNEEFVAAYTGCGPALEAGLRTLAAQGPAMACATLGPRGALAFDGQSFYPVAAFPIRAVDTTGAGDAFRAGYLYALLAGWPLPARLDFASATAALTCTGPGAQSALPTRDQVLALLAAHRRPGPWESAPAPLVAPSVG